MHHQDHNYSPTVKSQILLLTWNTNLSKLKATNTNITKNHIPYSNHLILIRGMSQNCHLPTQKPEITYGTVLLILLLFERFSTCPKKKESKKELRKTLSLEFTSCKVSNFKERLHERVWPRVCGGERNGFVRVGAEKGVNGFAFGIWFHTSYGGRETALREGSSSSSHGGLIFLILILCCLFLVISGY